MAKLACMNIPQKNEKTQREANHKNCFASNVRHNQQLLLDSQEFALLTSSQAPARSESNTLNDGHWGAGGGGGCSTVRNFPQLLQLFVFLYLYTQLRSNSLSLLDG